MIRLDVKPQDIYNRARQISNAERCPALAVDRSFQSVTLRRKVEAV